MATDTKLFGKEIKVASSPLKAIVMGRVEYYVYYYFFSVGVDANILHDMAINMRHF